MDPDALILNFSQSDDPDVGDESGAGSIRGEDEEDGKAPALKEREDYFVFSAFVPPGKHMLVLRDTGTFAHRKHQKQVKFDNEGESGRAGYPPGLNPTRMQSDSSLEEDDYFKGKAQKLKRTGQGGGSSSLLMGHISEDKSEYYFKELLVEPRQNPVMATHSKPFTFEYSPMKVLNKKTKPV